MAATAEAVIQWVMVLIAGMLAESPGGEIRLVLDEGDGVERRVVVAEDAESPGRALVFEEDEGEREELGALTGSEDFLSMTWTQPDGYEESVEILPLRGLFDDRSEDVRRLEEGETIELEMGGETYTLRFEDDQRLRVSLGEVSVWTEPFSDEH